MDNPLHLFSIHLTVLRICLCNLKWPAHREEELHYPPSVMTSHSHADKSILPAPLSLLLSVSPPIHRIMLYLVPLRCGHRSQASLSAPMEGPSRRAAMVKMCAKRGSGTSPPGTKLQCSRATLKMSVPLLALLSPSLNPPFPLPPLCLPSHGISPPCTMVAAAGAGGGEGRGGERLKMKKRMCLRSFPFFSHFVVTVT
jgi:hypothetical protein